MRKCFVFVCFFKRKGLRSRKSRQREIPLRREKKEDSVTKPGMEMLEKSSQIHQRGCTSCEVRVRLKGGSRCDTKQGLQKQRIN